MAERSRDWIEQADRDLMSAKSQREAGFHEWACFIAQQGAEKALKALLQSWGAEARGHSITQLLSAVRDRTAVAPGLEEGGRILDRYYIPSRYPNGYAQGKPGDYFKEHDADAAIAGAEEIIRFCNGLLAR